MASREDCATVVVEEAELKRKTGEFDLETIFFLDLSDQGLRGLGAVVKCVNLRVLKLSGNGLDDVKELSSIVGLEELDLSDNHISSLKRFDKLEKLERLDLPGNNLSELDCLLPLCGLCHLKNLSLRVWGSSLSNPLCSSTAHGGYELFMSQSFPNLSWLDGERVGGVGGGVREERTELEKQLKMLGKESDEKIEREAEDEGEDQLMDVSLNDSLAMEKIKRLLSECSDTSQKVQKHIKSLQKDILN